MKLRTDERQWLIYDEPAVVAASRALELICLTVAGQWLAEHEDISLRGLGNLALKIADTRTRYGFGFMKNSTPTDEEQAATAHALEIIGYLAGDRDRPVVAEDELHAAAVWLNTRLKEAGVDGDGWYRHLAKGTG